MMSVIGKRSSRAIAMYMRGISGKWNAMWHSSPSPKYSLRVLRPLVGLGQQHACPAHARRARRGCVFRIACVSGRFSLLVPSRSTR